MNVVSYISMESVFSEIDQYIKDQMKITSKSYYEQLELLLHEGISQQHIESGSALYTLTTWTEEAELKRQLYQLLLLSGLKTDPIAVNHHMTPDSIGFLMAYLVELFTESYKKTSLTLLDPVVGTGNLLFTVINYLKEAGYPSIYSYGIDQDELLVDLAYTQNELMNLDGTYIVADTLKYPSSELSQIDIAIADLPIGYYAHNDDVQEYKVATGEELTYAHHLLMEKTMHMLKPSGTAFFLVPEHLFSSSQSKQLMQWLKADVYFQAMIHLPENLFKKQNAKKSIMILQNKGPKTHPVEKVFITSCPEFKNKPAMAQFLKQLQHLRQEVEK